MHTPRFLVAPIAFALLALAACGSDDPNNEGDACATHKDCQDGSNSVHTDMVCILPPQGAEGVCRVPCTEQSDCSVLFGEYSCCAVPGQAVMACLPSGLCTSAGDSAPQL